MTGSEQVELKPMPLPFSDPIVAIKGQFLAPDKKYNGMFLIMLNSEAGYIDNASVVAGLPDKLALPKLSANWMAYDKALQSAWYEQRTNASLTSQLQALFKEKSLEISFYQEIYSALEKKSLSALQSIFFKILDDVLRDPKLEVSVDAEPVPSQTIVEAPAPDSAFVEPEESWIPVSLSLAPIGGKDIGSIQGGDVIMVKPDATNPRGKSLINSKKLQIDNGRIKPMPAKVTAVLKSSEGIELTVKLADTLSGKILETEKVLVEMYIPPSVRMKNASIAKANQEEKKSLQVVYIAGGILLLLILLLAIFL